jgi:protein-tyrosine phosphatase
VIDLHAHVLAGLDDGPADQAEAIEVLAAAAGEGVSVIAATPHVSERYPNSPAAIERELAWTVAAVEEQALPLTVVGAGEIELTWLPRLGDDDLQRLSFGGLGRYVLVELPWDEAFGDLTTSLERLAGLGLRAVIAHPERHTEVQERPGRLEALVTAGALLQLNASSLVGLHGRRAAKTATELLSFGLAHLVASDRHGGGIRRATMTEARRSLGGGALAEWLTTSVPEAVLRGGELPPRPQR